MKGTIKAYSPAANAGCIDGVDGKVYHFERKEWDGLTPPVIAQDVTFTDKDDRATAISGGK